MKKARHHNIDLSRDLATAVWYLERRNLNKLTAWLRARADSDSIRPLIRFELKQMCLSLEHNQWERGAMHLERSVAAGWDMLSTPVKASLLKTAKSLREGRLGRAATNLAQLRAGLPRGRKVG